MKLIDVKALVDALKVDASHIMFDGYGNYTSNGLQLLEIIGRLPTIESEQKIGKWIVVKDDIFADTYYCSICHTSPLIDDMRYVLSNYCPNCGARMERDAE